MSLGEMESGWREKKRNVGEAMYVFLILALIGGGLCMLIVFGRTLPTEIVEGSFLLNTLARMALGALILLLGFLRFLSLARQSPY